MNDDLTTAVSDFLAHTRALGRKSRTGKATLRLLLAFAGQHGVTHLRQLTPGLLDEFAASRPRPRARSFNHLIGNLGCFLDWAVAQQRLDASALRATRRRETDRRPPFLFDTAQARRLLNAAAALPDNSRARGRGQATTPSSPCATGSGCAPGKHAACASVTSITAGRSWRC